MQAILNLNHQEKQTLSDSLVRIWEYVEDETLQFLPDEYAVPKLSQSQLSETSRYLSTLIDENKNRFEEPSDFVDTVLTELADAGVKSCPFHRFLSTQVLHMACDYVGFCDAGSNPYSNATQRYTALRMNEDYTPTLSEQFNQFRQFINAGDNAFSDVTIDWSSLSSPQAEKAIRFVKKQIETYRHPQESREMMVQNQFFALADSSCPLTPKERQTISMLVDSLPVFQRVITHKSSATLS